MFRILGFVGSRAESLRFGVLGFRAWGLGFGVWGLGFWVLGIAPDTCQRDL